MLRFSLPLLLLAAAPLLADGPADNVPDNVRPIPPKAAPLPDDVKAELTAGLKELQKAIADIERAPKERRLQKDLLPDVQIYEQAVRFALEYDELYVDAGKKRNDVPLAKDALKRGLDRAKELAAGKPSWTTAKGLVVRGYKSKIDGSVQPYGLVIPEDYDFDGDKQHRLDFWWHGRFEDKLELAFLADRQKNVGQFAPAGAIVVHPFGRFSNANKFAGEVDTFEVLQHVKKHYHIDPDRIVARGFSMGGAACWQYAVHFPTLWAAAAPGAGFAETKEFLNNFQNEQVKPQWWEEKLWRMYDATEYAGNLFNLPVVAYSGENDKQKQAADIMVKYAKAAGVEFPHIIGKGAGHNYTPEAKKEINERIDAIVANGKPILPEEVRFTTYTTRYNRCGWVGVTGLEKHWEKGTVTGTLTDGVIEVKTSGVTRLAFPVRELTRDVVRKVIVDGTTLWQADRTDADSAINVLAPQKVDGQWQVGNDQLKADAGSVKGPGLQGPIDDAFMDSFVMVRPTGKPLNDTIGAWADTEMKHAIKHWRQQFRGDAPVKDDKDITDDDIKNSNLILWGDSRSNAILAKIADKLPMKWESKEVIDGGKRWTATVLDVGGTGYDPEKHMPVMIFPNPLNPTKYVVLNSGFTYREYAYLNNARQVPMLPDYAVVDITTPPNSRYPGKVVRAGFFNEQWKLQKDDGR